MDNVIELFLEQFYNRHEGMKSELECYTEMKKISEKILIEELEKVGCKAIVTSRIKDKDSLRRKLYKRDENSEKYKTSDDIWNDIFDFLGLRISLYFPNDMEMVDKVIRNNFSGKFSDEKTSIENTEEKSKKDPVENPIIHPRENKQLEHQKQNDYIKEFSGYKARHYRVSLQDDIMKRIKGEQEIRLNPVFEIQVISLVLHAWAEVEHDIVYKSNGKKLSREIHKTLDDINGLMQLGERAFKRLKCEMLRDIAARDRFTDHYELSVYIRDNVSKEVLNTHDIGNMQYLFNLLQSAMQCQEDNMTEIEKINEMISKIEFGSMKYLAGEFVTYLMIESPDYYERNCIHKSKIHVQKNGNQEQDERLLKKYKSFIKKYAYFLHCAYKKGKEKEIFKEIKPLEDSSNEFIDMLLSNLLNVNVERMAKFRHDIYNVSNNIEYQSEPRINELEIQLKEYQDRLDVTY